MEVVKILKYRQSGEIYFLNKRWHRLNQNKPALIDWDGYKAWFRNGRHWRENGAAQISSNGQSRYFFKDGIEQ